MDKVSVRLEPHMEITTIHSESPFIYIGMLNQDTTQTLNALRAKFSTTFTSFLLLRHDSPHRSKPKQGAPHRYDMCINLSGPSSIGHEVGDFLSGMDIFLQHPTLHDDILPYENPHYLLPPGTSMELPDDLEVVDSTTKGSRMSAKSSDGQLSIAAQMLDAAQGPDLYGEVVISERLTTSLKRFVALSSFQSRLFVTIPRRASSKTEDARPL